MTKFEIVSKLNFTAQQIQKQTNNVWKQNRKYYHFSQKNYIIKTRANEAAQIITQWKHPITPAHYQSGKHHFHSPQQEIAFSSVGHLWCSSAAAHRQAWILCCTQCISPVFCTTSAAGQIQSELCLKKYKQHGIKLIISEKHIWNPSTCFIIENFK